MTPTADSLLRKCERYIAMHDYDNARKCAKGISILTGQDAWELAYLSIIDNQNPLSHVKQREIELPAGLVSRLHTMHDNHGIEIPNQSVRGGTQVNLTHDAEAFGWVKHITGQVPIGIWTTRLPTGGYHIPHIHPRGKVSHVVYVEVPRRNSGYIYFGVPRYIDIPKRYKIFPHEGLMLSFPHWLWHGVSTYEGKRPRMTIAFDTHDG